MQLCECGRIIGGLGHRWLAFCFLEETLRKSFRTFENRSLYHRTVVPIAVGDVLSFEASLKTADAAMTRANNAIIAAISIDLGSRRRLSEFLCMNRAPAADASG
jgi:hypothetical protein